MYSNNTDEENIKLIRNNQDDGAMEYLIKKYKGAIVKESRGLYIIGADQEDIVQEGMIGLFKAIRDYDETAGASFFTFAYSCIRRQMLTAVTTAARMKHAPLNSYISIYKNEGFEDAASIVDSMEADISVNPETATMASVASEELVKAMDNLLSKFEKNVLDLYLQGKSYAEIGDVLNKPAKSVDNAIQRIRGKLKDFA